MTNENQVKEIEWELLIEENDVEYFGRLKVDGGYLYRNVLKAQNNFISNTLCFVPDVDLTRYQAHLRDAYKKGYSDGQADSRVGISAPPE